MTEPLDALVERLEKYRGGTTEFRDIMDEAATELKAMQTEIGRLRKWMEAHNLASVYAALANPSPEQGELTTP